MKLKVDEHQLVPDHERLEEEEVEAVLEEYNISKENLPKIEKNDAALKSMEVSAGDVIKITRDSEKAGTINYYRLVI